MLSELTIVNFALIEHHRLEFHAGMTVLTGETGAGKSIIIDALSLVLGERADNQVIRHGADRCEISARFDLAPQSAAYQWLNAQQLISDDECLIRRVLSRDGKSRATVNGMAATAQQLRQLGELLVNIHGQHQHQALLKKISQRQLVDHYGRHDALLANVASHYQAWHATKKRQAALQDVNEQHNRREFIQFQLEEWQGLKLSQEAIEQLELEHKSLAHSGDRLEKAQRALSLLNADDSTTLSQTLHLARQQLQHMDPIPARIGNAISALDGAIIQVDEACHDLHHYLDEAELNPERLAEIDQLLQTLHRLARKHRVSASELPAFYQHLSDELKQLDASEAELAQIDQVLAQHQQAYQQAAEHLSIQRRQTATRLAHDITERMQQLAMPGGRFAIEFESLSLAEPHLYGNEQLEFYVSANPGQPLQALSKVASGGELSRISLAIQVILADTTTTPTLIFDEVDVGIGGPTAAVVGQVMRDLSQHAQVLCVTHLPQVAACGHQHFQIAKHINDGHTTTQVTLLDLNARYQEIARMLGGLDLTEQSLAHAKQLLRLA